MSGITLIKYAQIYIYIYIYKTTCVLPVQWDPEKPGLHEHWLGLIHVPPLGHDVEPEQIAVK